MDAVIVRGGGRTCTVAATVLPPRVVDAVDIPVITAGGFRDGRGLVAAPAFGAAGIAMGTRFLPASHWTVPDAVKARHPAAGVEDITLTTAVDGLPHRMPGTETAAAPEHAGRVRAPAQAVRRASGFRGISGGRAGPGWCATASP